MTEIRVLSQELCKSASKLEKSCLSTAWSEEQLKEIIDKDNYKYVVALENEDVHGVGGAICSSPDSAEIFTVAVLKSQRGKGTGKRIVSALIEFCASKNAESIFLEVEEENVPAISLYSRMGFEKVGIRKGFYREKNAIIMQLNLKQQ